MESGQPTNVSVHQQHVMTPINEANKVRSNNDIMTRRLKNRERQRRYRARKRLEAERNRDQSCQLLEFHGADLRNTGNNTQSGLVAAIDVPIMDTPQNFASRVHCRRDWKKDARRVHLDKQQTAGGEKQVSAFTTQINNADAPIVTEAQQRAPPLQDNDGARRVVHSRRHWKAEARNKKS